MPTMRSTDFRSVVEPILNEVFDGVYDQRKDEYKMIFKEKEGIPRNYHEEPVLYGFAAAPEIPDGAPVEYQQGGELYIARYLYRRFGMAYALTKVLVEDGDHIRIGSIYARHAAQSIPETMETRCANVLNTAFTVNGPDGVPLNSASHPIVGGTYSNLLATAAVLSQTSVEQLITQVRQAVDNTGKKIRITPLKLIVHPANMIQAEVILKSVLRSGTANNDFNVVSGYLAEQTAVISRLTSTTAWWIKTDVDNGLQVIKRGGIAKSMEGNFETDSMRYKAIQRWAEGYTDPRTVFGTPGV